MNIQQHLHAMRKVQLHLIKTDDEHADIEIVETVRGKPNAISVEIRPKGRKLYTMEFSLSQLEMDMNVPD
jgi:hypothetical protein